MKNIFVMAFMLFVSAQSLAMTSKDACDELKPVMIELQAQTPMVVDYVTTMTGVQVIYASKICFLNYSYVINTEAFVKDMMSANELSEEENKAFLRTPEGKATLQDTFDQLAKNAKDSHFQPFKEIKGMSISYSYSFDDVNFPSIKAVVLEN